MLTDTLIDLDRGSNRCPSCKVRLRLKRRSRVWYEIARLGAAFLLLGACALVYNSFFAKPGISFLQLSKVEAFPWVLASSIVFVVVFYRLASRYVLLEPEPPSIGRPLSDQELGEMAALGVEYNEQYFAVGDNHFDHLGDALEFARARQSQNGVA